MVGCTEEPADCRDGDREGPGPLIQRSRPGTRSAVPDADVGFRLASTQDGVLAGSCQHTRGSQDLRMRCLLQPSGSKAAAKRPHTPEGRRPAGHRLDGLSMRSVRRQLHWGLCQRVGAGEGVHARVCMWGGYQREAGSVLRAVASVGQSADVHFMRHSSDSASRYTQGTGRAQAFPAVGV